MKKLTLTMFACILCSNLSFAQPPPPHPGGSGNQGANLPVMGLALTAGLACLIVFNKRKNNQNI